MVICYPSSPGKLAMTVGVFLGGVSMFVGGAYYSYKNVEPQRARTVARDNLVKDHLAKKFGYDWSKPEGYKRLVANKMWIQLARQKRHDIAAREVLVSIVCL